MEREPNTQYVLSLSYGKDSIACIEACRQLGYPIDRIVHAEVWFNDEIPADLPPMVEFKKKADEIIKERYGIEVEHTCATCTIDKKYSPNFPLPLMVGGGYKRTYTDWFYYEPKTSKYGVGHIKGFPNTNLGWCHKLKESVLETYLRRHILQTDEITWGGGTDRVCNESDAVLHGRTQTECHTVSQFKEGTGATDSRSQRYGFPVRKGAWCHTLKNKEEFSSKPLECGGVKNTIQYLGIASDEPERIARHSVKKGIILPLVDIGWDEAYCRKWCEENGLLSPIYTTATRGGCWFCHNQGVDQLRRLRHDYPELWGHLLRLDSDSPVTFHADGHTVHDFDRRFKLEDEGWVDPNEHWRWEYLQFPPFKQISLFDFIEK